MLNIAITAGGTSENVDGVRKLTNVSTGKLGWECLEAVLDFFSTSETEFHIYYIHTETAYIGEMSEADSAKVDFISVTDAASVYNVVDQLTKNISVTHFIHSMAISDFTFSYAVTVENLAHELYQKLNENPKLSAEEIKKTITQPESSYSEDSKISSKEPLLIGLKTTRKVISLIKKNNPDTFLVGFKLLRNVTEKDLMREAQKLTNQNGCDMVFANELSRISGSDHTGLLIKKGVVVARPKGKDEIAREIVREMIGIR